MKFNKFIYLTLSILSLNTSLFGTDLEGQISNPEDNSNARINQQTQEDGLDSQENKYAYLEKFREGMSKAFIGFASSKLEESRILSARMDIIDDNINALYDQTCNRINQQQRDIDNIINWIKDKDNSFAIQNSSSASNSNKKIYGIAAIAIVMGAGIASYKKVYNYIKTKLYKQKSSKSKNNIKKIALNNKK